MKNLIAIIMGVIIIIGSSWAATVGIIGLITMCFRIEFDLGYATGIWLILWLLLMVFKTTKNSKE